MATHRNPPFDAYEIAPVAVWTDARFSGESCERCETVTDAKEVAEANGGYVIWTLYGHYATGHNEWIADATPEGCARILSSILHRPVDIDEEVGTVVKLETPDGPVCIAHSSHGTLKFSMTTGVVLQCNEDPGSEGELQHIAVIDVWELRRRYPSTPNPTDVDILAVGYWTRDNKYEPAIPPEELCGVTYGQETK